MNDAELIKEINTSMSMALQDGISGDELEHQLESYINQLILTDFQKLIMLLYRIDVSEQKLKQLLQQYPEKDAGKMIAGLIIERQLQKIKNRGQPGPMDDGITDEERW